jgi:uncharacterized protein (TIGR03083 family)
MSRHAQIDYGRLLEVLGIEGELLATSAHGARPALPVPGCPGLVLGEVVRHTGSVYRMVCSWIRDGRRPDTWQRAPDGGQDAIEYHRSGLRELLAELTAHQPDEPCATWWPADTSYGFWRRRMAHETTVHRVDVQAAAGRTVDSINEDVAVDGIDEVLILWFGHRLAVLGVGGTWRGTVGVTAGERSWLIRAGPEGMNARRATSAELADVDALVSGPPAQVYLWLWGRLPPRVVQWNGDGDAIAQVWALLRLATR